MQRLCVVNRTRNTTVGDKIELAGTSLTRMWGLLGRRSLNAGEGLWITPSSGVHTLGMKFPIDVVGLDRHKRVVKLWPALVPYRLTSVSLKISSVIELAAGGIDASCIEIGDQLDIVKTTA
jgi:uncharacterized membrane protein (UPF0127 family)